MSGVAMSGAVVFFIVGCFYCLFDMLLRGFHRSCFARYR